MEREMREGCARCDLGHPWPLETAGVADAVIEADLTMPPPPHTSFSSPSKLVAPTPSVRFSASRTVLAARSVRPCTLHKISWYHVMQKGIMYEGDRRSSDTARNAPMNQQGFPHHARTSLFPCVMLLMCTMPVTAMISQRSHARPTRDDGTVRHRRQG